MLADLQGVVLRVDPKRIEAQGLKDRVPLQPMKSSIDVVPGEGEEVANMEPLRRRIWEHHQRIEGILPVFDIRVIGSTFAPPRLPFGFDGRGVINIDSVGVCGWFGTVIVESSGPASSTSGRDAHRGGLVRQSSGAQKGSKPMARATSQVAGTTLVAGIVGAALVAVGSWGAGHAILDLDGWVLVGIVAAALGAGLLITAGLLSAFSTASDAQTAQRLAESLEGLARGDLRADPPDVQVSGSWFPVLQSAAHAIRFLRGALTAARQFARETRERSDEVMGQAAAAHSVAQRTSELTAHAAQHAGTLREEARITCDDLQRLTSDASTLATAARREQGRCQARSTRVAADSVGHHRGGDTCPTTGHRSHGDLRGTGATDAGC
jgi:hypothetical protein